MRSDYEIMNDYLEGKDLSREENEHLREMIEAADKIYAEGQA